MMDMHRLEANGGIPELWYSNQYPYSRVLQAWSNMIGALQYKWNFFAVDLKVRPLVGHSGELARLSPALHC